jgi:hypothetical protein
VVVVIAEIGLTSVLMFVLVFGVAPGFVLRLLVMLYPKDDPRRRELVAELYTLGHLERLLFVGEQFETALFEAIPARLAARRGRRPRGQSFDAALPGREFVEQFRTTASPEALALARLLAAVPITRAVAEVVRARFVPEATEKTVEDLISSGLLRPSVDMNSAHEFVLSGPAREALLSGARRSTTASVVAVVATYFRYDGVVKLRDAIADPYNTPDPVLTQETVADITVEFVVLQALSGPYFRRADRLRRQLTALTDSGGRGQNVAIGLTGLPDVPE